MYSGIEIAKEELLQKLLDTTQTMIFWKDTERRFVGVNQAFLDYYGFPSQDVLLGKTDEEMGWHANPDPFENDEWQVLHQGICTHMVHGKCVARGEERDILASKKPLYNQGKIIGLVGSFIDISEQVRQKNEIERLTRKLDGIPGGIAVYSRRYGELYCVSVNRCMLQMMGTEANDVVGKTVKQLLDRYMIPEEKDRFWKEFPVLRGNQRQALGTYQFQNQQNQKKIWLQINCQLVRDSDDEERIYCSYTNVNRLILYEKEVLASRHLAEERYARAMQMLGADRGQNLVARGYYNFTKNQVIDYTTYMASVYEMRLPMTYDNAFAGLMALSYTPGDHQVLESRLDRQHILRLYEQGETRVTVRYRRLLPANEPMWISLVMDFFANPKTGDVEGISYAYDITVQVMEEAIINRLGSLGYDEVGLIYCDSGFWRCYQYNQNRQNRMHTSGAWESEIGRYLSDNVLSEQAAQVKKELSLAYILEQLAHRESYVCSQTTVLADGAHQQKEIRFSYLNDDKETIFYCMSDITERFRHEHMQISALKKAKQEAEDANEARSVFFASISHDMRTPLNGVIGYTDLALEAADIDRMREYLAKIRVSGNLLLSLINDVLDFGKYVSNKIKLKLEPVTIAMLCDHVNTVIRPLAEHKHIDLRIERLHPLDGQVYADVLRLQQLTVNLLSNAIKFTHVGGHVECLFREEETSEGIQFRILVKDNGIGMSAEFLPKLFLPYVQEERTSVSKTLGTGLGMAIVKKIVELMGGRIQVASQIDVGTTFTVDLLLAKYQGGNFVPESLNHHAYTAILEGKHVLLCEDNELNAEIAQLLLEHWGMRVTWKENGKLGLEAFLADENAYDMILMDKRMPVMDGLDATAAIRKLEYGTGHHTPILAMTGDVDEESIKSCVDAGMDDHVGKPINRSELARSMVRMLKQRVGK